MSESSSAETRSLCQSRRELWLILLAWLGGALGGIGYSAANGYNLTPEEVATVLGFPGWVFWGVVAPWMTANAFTFWFCLRALKNDEDEEEAP